MIKKLQVKSLFKKYGDFELNNVTFDVPCGTVVGLIGENGAGKSTVIKSILGCTHPDKGEILFESKNIDLLSDKEKQKIAFVLDDTGLPMELTLSELNKVLISIFDKWDQGKFNFLLGRMNLPKDKTIKDFSKGMKMKAAIAVALSYDSELLILDEPTGGLDPVSRDEIIEMLYDYIQNENKSVLISSHIASDLEKLCDYIVYLNKGKVVLNEEKDALLEKFVIYSCDENDLKELDRKKVVRIMRRAYGADVMQLKEDVPERFSYRKAGLEDIMLFYSKGVSL